MKDITVFISYSWDSESHKEWVRGLADYLIKTGSMDVILDQYDLEAGKDMVHFIESAIEKADKVLLILTPNYKVKAENRKAGVGFEYSIISAELFEVQSNNTKFIPILRTGNKSQSSPGYTKTLVYFDMNNNDTFVSDAFKLIRILYEEPEFKKPSKGPKPDLEKHIDSDPILEMVNGLSNKMEIDKKRAIFEYREAVRVIENEIPAFFKTIYDKANEYKSKTTLFFRCDYNDRECRLIIEGFCLILKFKISAHLDINRTDLKILLYDKLAPIGNEDRYYFPGEEPNNIFYYTFVPKVTDDLEIFWNYEKLQYNFQKLVGFAFSILLEYIKENKKPDIYL